MWAELTGVPTLSLSQAGAPEGSGAASTARSDGGAGEVKLPAAALERAAPLIWDFRQGRRSGSVTIVLHFLHGEDMPSEVGMYERQVGGRRCTTKVG
jgi:hypothetical protein